uniref:Androgen dependent TFPI regulating protein n=1 Tax=Myotis myotis TaxID=51298 RepID=A0A7J7ZSE7_MYOMY|nr:androgen dependent TFPI regulating protein [Myotis myotis]
MTRTSTCVYHFLVLSWYIFLNYHISQKGRNTQMSKVFQNGGQWKYLTLLNLHTFILPFSLVEVILRPHCYPLKKNGLTLLAAASLAYICRVLWIYSETGTWVYPVFAKLSPVGLAAFFSLSYIFIASIYLLGEKLNHCQWGEMRQPKKKK